MKTLSVYDPALCCSSGVCGTEVDQTLVSFSADVTWLKQQGGSVWQMDRIRLDPAAGLFTSQPDSDSRLWCGADEAVMTAVAVPGGAGAPEEYRFDAGSGLLNLQTQRVWAQFVMAL